MPYSLCQNSDFFFEDFTEKYSQGYVTRPSGDRGFPSWNLYSRTWLPREGGRKQAKKKQALLAHGVKLRYLLSEEPIIVMSYVRQCHLNHTQERDERRAWSDLQETEVQGTSGEEPQFICTQERDDDQAHQCGDDMRRDHPPPRNADKEPRTSQYETGESSSFQQLRPFYWMS